MDDNGREHMASHRPPHEEMPPRRKPGVLVVDDTRSNLVLLSAALHDDYRVHTARDGAAALDLLKQEDKPDLILLDIVMPGMDGYEVCRRIKENPTTRNIPIIFITSMDQAADQQKGFALGAVDYITRPFELPLLMARIAVHVRLKLKSEMLERLAFLDGLTDIPNRRAIEQALSQEWSRARRDGTSLGLLMIDVDEFKAFNDCRGHGAGDDCLVRIAHELHDGLHRPGDFVGRYGGEEFLVILPDCDLTGAAHVAEQLRQRVEALRISHPCSGVADHTTVSIGYASLHPSPEAEMSTLLEEADKGLYAAKSTGRNRVATFLPA